MFFYFFVAFSKSTSESLNSYRLSLKEREHLFGTSSPSHLGNSECLVHNLFKYKSKVASYYMKTLASNDLVYETSSFGAEIGEFKFELISIGLALVTMYIRYGSVFWFTNKTLSFLVTFIGFMGGIEQLMQLYSFVYLSKQIEFKHFSKYVLNLTPAWKTTSGQSNTSAFLLKLMLNQTLFEEADHEKSLVYEPIFSGQLIDSKFTLFFLYALLSACVYMSATPGYAFAYLKYKERFLIEEALFMRSTAAPTSKKQPDSKIAENTTSKQRILNQYVSTTSVDLNQLVANLNENTIVKPTSGGNSHTCCFNYCPHLIATIQLIVMCGCKLPFCYDYILYFNYYKDFGIMLCIIVEILHTIILLFIWLSLTLRNDWDMHLQTAYSVCHWTYHLKLKEKGLANKASKFKSEITKKICIIFLKIKITCIVFLKRACY